MKFGVKVKQKGMLLFMNVQHNFNFNFQKQGMCNANIVILNSMINHNDDYHFMSLCRQFHFHGLNLKLN